MKSKKKVVVLHPNLTINLFGWLHIWLVFSGVLNISTFVLMRIFFDFINTSYKLFMASPEGNEDINNALTRLLPFVNCH